MNDDPGNCVVEFNKISRDDWSRLMGSFGDSSIYQCWEYAEGQWDYCRRDHLVIWKAGEAVSLAQVIILKLPLMRVAYVPWGPLWKRRDRPVDVSLFRLTIKVLKAAYIHDQNMALRVRPNGLEENDSDIEKIMTESGFTQTKRNRREKPRTIMVDLESPETELRKRLAKNWRKSLGYSEKEDLKIRESFDERDILSIKPLYDAFKKKKNIEGANLTELSLIQSRLTPDQKMRITTCENHEGLIAGSICSGIGDSALGIIGVTSEEGRKRRAYYRLQWDEILWSKRNANKRYDLNGINPVKNPTVYHFKSGLRGREVTFLGLYDCCPNGTMKRLLPISDGLVKIVKKGNAIKALKKWLRAGR
jgi:lipid II:glycine glycyltransferase (peptidoglycan interpeptide bridge formation enzyme)